MEAFELDVGNFQGDFEKDEFYESIQAPKFHDFSAPEEPIDADVWFSGKPVVPPLGTRVLMQDAKSPRSKDVLSNTAGGPTAMPCKNFPTDTSKPSPVARFSQSENDDPNQATNKVRNSPAVAPSKSAKSTRRPTAGLSAEVPINRSSNLKNLREALPVPPSTTRLPKVPAAATEDANLQKKEGDVANECDRAAETHSQIALPESTVRVTAKALKGKNGGVKTSTVGLDSPAQQSTVMGRSVGCKTTAKESASPAPEECKEMKKAGASTEATSSPYNGHHCRSSRCAANNPNYASPACVPPRKYLVARRATPVSKVQGSVRIDPENSELTCFTQGPEDYSDSKEKAGTPSDDIDMHESSTAEEEVIPPPEQAGQGGSMLVPESEDLTLDDVGGPSPEDSGLLEHAPAVDQSERESSADSTSEHLKQVRLEEVFQTLLLSAQEDEGQVSQVDVQEVHEDFEPNLKRLGTDTDVDRLGSGGSARGSGKESGSADLNDLDLNGEPQYNNTHVSELQVQDSLENCQPKQMQLGTDVDSKMVGEGIIDSIDRVLPETEDICGTNRPEEEPLSVEGVCSLEIPIVGCNTSTAKTPSLSDVKTGAEQKLDGKCPGVVSQLNQNYEKRQGKKRKSSETIAEGGSKKVNSVSEDSRETNNCKGRGGSKEAAGSCGAKHKKKVTTSPHPFRLRTQERGVLKEIEFNKKMEEYIAAREGFHTAFQGLTIIKAKVNEDECKRPHKHLALHAQKVPCFDRPFKPHRSTKKLTVPQEFNFHGRRTCGKHLVA